MCSWFTNKKITTVEQDELISGWLKRTREWAKANMDGVDPSASDHESRIFNKNLARYEAANELLEYLEH